MRAKALGRKPTEATRAKLSVASRKFWKRVKELQAASAEASS